jgi:hypothetical protein
LRADAVARVIQRRNHDGNTELAGVVIEAHRDLGFVITGREHLTTHGDEL